MANYISVTVGKIDILINFDKVITIMQDENCSHIFLDGGNKIDCNESVLEIEQQLQAL